MYNIAYNVQTQSGQPPLQNNGIYQTDASQQACVPYDVLILATGVRHVYFGNDSWESHAPGLKYFGDVVMLRRKILTAFERAESATNSAEQKRQLTFVVVGAGPTGVETAGALAELAYRTLANEFRHINSEEHVPFCWTQDPEFSPHFLGSNQTASCVAGY